MMAMLTRTTNACRLQSRQAFASPSLGLTRAPVLACGLPAACGRPAPLASYERQGRRTCGLSVLAQAVPSTVPQTEQAAAAAVRIIIQGRKLKVTDAIKSYVEAKVSHAVARFKQAVIEVDVTLSVRGGDSGSHGKKEQRVEVTIKTARCGVVRVEDAEDSLYAAVDLVCDKIARKLGRVKDMAILKGRWPGRGGPKGKSEDDAEFEAYKQEVLFETQVAEEAEARDHQFEVLNKSYPVALRRSKVVELEPMSVDDALEAMDAVGHDFYVFRELESDSIQVVYKRSAEGYGVIIPKKKD